MTVVEMIAIFSSNLKKGLLGYIYILIHSDKADSTQRSDRIFLKKYEKEPPKSREIRKQIQHD